MTVTNRVYYLLKQVVYYARRLLASRDPPNKPALYVPGASPERLKQVLGGYYFAPAWLLSYHYHGETLNMRRVEYRPAKNPRPWRQFHIRGYVYEDGALLQPHTEPEALQYPGAHRTEEPETEDALKRLGVILGMEGYDYEVRRVP